MPDKDPNTSKQHQQLTQQAWELFVEYLKKKSDRITKARRIVFDEVFRRHDHFRADEIASDLAKGVNRVSRGTVYRTLALMLQADLVREIRDNDTHAHFEHIYGHPQHEHMICSKCGSFVEFVDEKLTSHIRQACQQHCFEPQTWRVTVFGICRTCQQKHGQK